MLNAYRATGEKKALEKALGLIAFAEKKFKTPEGLFSVGMTNETDQAQWLWSVEEVEKELTPDEAAWGEEVAGSIEMASSMIGFLAAEFSIAQEFISIDIRMDDFRDGTLH